MRKKSVRLASAALAVCMMLSALPMGAFAAEPGEETENGVSAQAETVTKIEDQGADYIISVPGIYTMEGTYAHRVVVRTDGDVTIRVTGNIDYTNAAASGNVALWQVEKVNELTIENENQYTVQTTVPGIGGPQLLREEYGVSIKKITVNGGIYKQVCNNSGFQFSSGGEVELNHITMEMGGRSNAIYSNRSCKVIINGGSFAGDNAPVLCFNGSGSAIVTDANVSIQNGNAVQNTVGTCEIYGGTYTVDGEYAGIYNTGTMTIDRGTKIISKATATGAVIANTTNGTDGNGTLIFNDGTITVEGDNARAAIGCAGNSTTIINGGTIENAECGVWVRQGTPSVTLKKADFKNNTSDIYLGTGLTIAIEDTFTDTATVKCEDARSGRQITTSNTNGQEKLKLISNDVAANGKTYRVAYDKDGTFRYLTPRAENRYTVTAENATAALVDGTPLYSYDEIEAGKDVTLTADAPEDGWVFAGWQVTEGGLTLNDTTGTVTFQMPTSDVVVSAQYEYVGTPDAAVDNIQGALSAVVVGAAAGVIIYEAGTGIYRVINMPGIPMPSNRIELAELLWERADKPEPVSTALYDDIDEDDTDAQKAAHWAVEQDLMQDDEDDNEFHPHFPVSKLRTCLTWNAAKEKGLFDNNKTAE